MIAEDRSEARAIGRQADPSPETQKTSKSKAHIHSDNKITLGNIQKLVADLKLSLLFGIDWSMSRRTLRYASYATPLIVDCCCFGT